MVRECVVLGCLFLLAWMDLKKMELSLPLLAIFAALGMICQVAGKDLSWESVLGGTLLGGAVLLLAFVSRESIGIGDGLLFCASGVCLGFQGNLELLCLSSFGAAAAALILMWRKQYTRQSRIPFVPFVLAADVCRLLQAGL